MIILFAGIMKALATLTIASIITCTQSFAGNPHAPPKRKAYFDSVTIPNVRINGAELATCLDFAGSLAVAHDDEIDLKKKGFKIHGLPMAKRGVEITYLGKNVTLTMLLQQIAERARLDLHLTSVGVVLSPPGSFPLKAPKHAKGEIWETLYRVPPDAPLLKRSDPPKELRRK